jgi:hypothetical protein
VNEITDHLLLHFSVEASDVEAHHCDFLQLFQFFVGSPLPVVSSACCIVVRCCSRVRLPLPPTILLLWCCHVGVLLLFLHSRIRIGIVLLVLLLVCRIVCCSILRSSSDILLHLGVRGIGEVHHLFCLAHIFCLLLHVGFWGFG